jgi:hypothetical protein
VYGSFAAPQDGQLDLHQFIRDMPRTNFGLF